MKKIFVLNLIMACLLTNLFAQLDSGLVFYLPCNGNLRDSSINKKLPILNAGAASPATDRWGKPNGAMAITINTLDGVVYKDSMMRSNIYTISMWVNVDSIRGNGRGKLFRIGIDPGGITYGVGIELDGSAGYEFITRTTAPSPNSALLISKNINNKTKRWIHLLGIRDTSTMAFYINDTLAGTKSIPTNAKNILWNPQDSSAVIFSRSTQFLLGLVDEVRVYNRMLTATERTALYNFEKPASYLALNKDTITIASPTTNQAVTISSNTSWAASSNQPWVSVNPTTGNNDASITLTIANNTTGVLRTALVTVTGNGVGTKTVVINQRPAPPDSLALNKDTLAIGNTAKTETINITSNRTWTVISDRAWATVNPTGGAGNGSFAINIAANAGGARVAKITVTAGSIIKTIIVNQAKSSTFIDSVKLSKDSIFAVKRDSTYTISVTSNTNWVTAANQSWVSITPTTGMGNATLQVTVNANAGIERKAEMTVTAGSVSRKVMIIQESKSVGLVEQNVPTFITYPNPVTNGVFTITNLPPSANHRICIYTLTGKLVSDIETIKTETQIEIPHMQAGLYFLTIQSSDGSVYNGKLVVE